MKVFPHSLNGGNNDYYRGDTPYQYAEAEQL